MLSKEMLLNSTKKGTVNDAQVVLSVGRNLKGNMIGYYKDSFGSVNRSPYWIVDKGNRAVLARFYSREFSDDTTMGVDFTDDTFSPDLILRVNINNRIETKPFTLHVDGHHYTNVTFTGLDLSPYLDDDIPLEFTPPPDGYL